MNDPFAHSRAILYYNGAISALTLFAQFPGGSVCAPRPLPLLSSVWDQGQGGYFSVTHPPASIASNMASLLELPADFLKANGDYRERVDVPQGVITVFLLRFDVLDPPHEWMNSKGCQLQTLTQLRGRPPAEMELLRRAYALLMES